MYGVFEFLILLPFFLMFTYILRHLLWRIHSQPIRGFIMILAFVGVIIHELCHSVVCLLMGYRPRKFRLHFYDEKTHLANPHGGISLDDHNMSFLQSFMISIAPLVVSMWLFFWSFGIILNPSENLDLFEFYFHLLFCISLLLGATPSHQDFVSAWNSFTKNPRYSLYQIFMLVLAGLIVWCFVEVFRIVLPLDILYYILVAFMYVVVKYSFRGLKLAIYYLATRNRSVYSHPKVNYTRYNRRHHRPSKPHNFLCKQSEEWDWE